MFRPWFLIPLTFACSSAPQSEGGKARGVDPARIERIERGLLPPVTVVGEELRYSIEQRMAELQVPALSIAVFDNFELQWAKAYGFADVEGRVQATDETTFLAGSISKSVNALAVLLAVGDGQLSLDAPINDALTSWKLPDNDLTRATPVTLRMLLSHTAGLTVHGFPGYAAGEPLPTLHQILDGAPPANTPAVRVDEAPGARFRYSGGGTTIAQLALIERSKQPYAELLAARVLEPLGMERSSFDQQLTPERLRHAAVGYDRSGDAIAGQRNAYPEMAAAGLWTTSTDLATFFLEIARARAKRPSRVPSAVAEQMTTKAIEASGEGVGLGVFLHQRNGAPFFGHSGADAGFQANALVSLDSGYGVVVMTNSENGFRIIPEIERALFAEYKWPGADAPRVRVALTDEHRAKLVGNFEAENGPFEIFDRDGSPQLLLPFEPAPVELVPIAPDVVVRRDGAAWIRIGAAGPIQLEHAQGPALPILRTAHRHYLFEIEAGNFDAAVAALRESIENKPDEESILNGIGYRLLGRDVPKAIDVLRLVATVVPDSSNAHDSLGDAYTLAKDTTRAIAAYQAALATLDADARIPADAKPARRAHAEAQLAMLRAADAPR